MRVNANLNFNQMPVKPHYLVSGHKSLVNITSVSFVNLVNLRCSRQTLYKARTQNVFVLVQRAVFIPHNVLEIIFFFLNYRKSEIL